MPRKLQSMIFNIMKSSIDGINNDFHNYKRLETNFQLLDNHIDDDDALRMSNLCADVAIPTMKIATTITLNHLRCQPLSFSMRRTLHVAILVHETRNVVRQEASEIFFSATIFPIIRRLRQLCLTASI